MALKRTIVNCSTGEVTEGFLTPEEEKAHLEIRVQREIATQVVEKKAQREKGARERLSQLPDNAVLTAGDLRGAGMI